MRVTLPASLAGEWLAGQGVADTECGDGGSGSGGGACQWLLEKGEEARNEGVVQEHVMWLDVVDSPV